VLANVALAWKRLKSPVIQYLESKDILWLVVTFSLIRVFILRATEVDCDILDFDTTWPCRWLSALQRNRASHLHHRRGNIKSQVKLQIIIESFSKPHIREFNIL
jgi:hypothetical protein